MVAICIKQKAIVVKGASGDLMNKNNDVLSALNINDRGMVYCGLKWSDM